MDGQALCEVVSICADALSLPLADGSVDIAFCSQLLHHFQDDDPVAPLRELDRVARRRCVIVCDETLVRTAHGRAFRFALGPRKTYCSVLAD